MKTGNMVRFREVDSALGGAPVDEALASSFEAACSEFSSLAQSRTGESQEQLEEIAKLLSVSEKNLEEVKNQKWFQRAWRTVSGHNRKLRNVNEQNMLRVQKGAVYFLQNLAESNQVLMKSVHQALKRVEALQVDNVRLKGYLVRLGKKFSDRMSHVEERLETVEQVVSVGQAGRGVDVRALVVANLSLFLSVVLLLVAGDSSAIRIVAGVLLFASVAGFALSFRAHLAHFVRRPLTVAATGNDERRMRRVRRKNSELLPKIKRVLTIGILNGCSDSIAQLGEPLGDRIAPALELLGNLEEEELDAEEYASVIETILSTTFSIGSEVEALCAEAAATCDERLDGMATAIAEQYLDNTLLYDVQSRTDREGSHVLEQRLAGVFRPVVTKAKSLNKAVRQLRPDFPRFRKYLTESVASAVGRNIIKGLLIIPVLIDDEVEFEEDFKRRWDSLVERIIGVLELQEESAMEQAHHAVEAHIESSVHRMAPLFEAFSDQGVSMKGLLTDLKEAVED